METVARVLVIYLFLLIGMRLLGKREFGQLSPLELVTLLIVPELVQQSLVRDDFSLTNAIVAVSTLFSAVFLTSALAHRFYFFEFLIAGKPAVLSRTVWDRPRYALRDATHKFLYDTRTGEEELYDLAADPGERSNVAAKEPLRAAYYRQALHHWTAGLQSPSGRSETAILTREQCENMKALGYLDPKTPCPKD